MTETGENLIAVAENSTLYTPQQDSGSVSSTEDTSESDDSVSDFPISDAASSDTLSLIAPTQAIIIHPSEINSIVCGLRLYTNWSYSQLQDTFHIPRATLHRILHNPRSQVRNSSLGRPLTIDDNSRSRLIELATPNATNRRLPLSGIADLAGLKIGYRALKRAFASEGYHRRIARIKPFLTQATKTKRKEWAEGYGDWTIQDWQDVIWSDECAFSVGQGPERVWVTRRPDEEYIEDCIVPKFPHRTTIMVWGAIYRNFKGPLII